MLKDFYDPDSQPIVKIDMIYGPKKNLVEKCLIIFSKSIYENVISRYECRQISSIGACNGNIQIWSFDNKGEEIAFYLSPIGSALAGGCVIEVNHLIGAS